MSSTTWVKAGSLRHPQLPPQQILRRQQCRHRTPPQTTRHLSGQDRREEHSHLIYSCSLQPAVGGCCSTNPDQHRPRRVYPGSDVCAPSARWNGGLACPGRWQCRTRVRSEPQAPELAAPPKGGGEDRRRRVRADRNQTRTVSSPRGPGGVSLPGDGCYSAMGPFTAAIPPAPNKSSQEAVRVDGGSQSRPRGKPQASIGGWERTTRFCEEEVTKGIRGK